MKIRDGERENRSLNIRVISFGQNHGKIDTTEARGAAAAAAASDRSSLALREERQRRARPRDRAGDLTGPAALSPNLVRPSPAVAEPLSSEPDSRASLGWRPRAFPSFKKIKTARLMLLEIAYFWVILFLFFFISWGRMEGAKNKNEQEVLTNLPCNFKDL
jgi:hypothetical protein